jgi:hypothetical protein
VAFTDVLLDADGDLPLTEGFASGDLVTTQALRRAINTHLGEFIGDQNQGLPYAAWLRARPVPVTDISLSLRRVIETFPGVEAITAWTVTHDEQSRSVSVSGTARLTTGAEVSLNSATPNFRNSLPFTLLLR